MLFHTFIFSSFIVFIVVAKMVSVVPQGEHSTTKNKLGYKYHHIFGINLIWKIRDVLSATLRYQL